MALFCPPTFASTLFRTLIINFYAQAQKRAAKSAHKYVFAHVCVPERQTEEERERVCNYDAIVSRDHPT